MTLVTPPAKHFAAEGASVFITGRRRSGEEEGCGGINASHCRLHDAVQQKHSQIDVLFTNAGGGSMLPLGAITEEQYEDTFGRNVKGVIFTVQKALSLLRDGAAVVLTGSTAGMTGTAAFSIYGASEGRGTQSRAQLDTGPQGAGHPRQRRQPRPREDAGPGGTRGS